MTDIARFFTLYWIIYFPTCIAYNELPNFGYVDEVMTVVLIGYTFLKKAHWSTNPEPWKEFFAFFGILAFYVVYSLIRQVNVPGAVWLEVVQQIRPYSVVYCTWILNPRFSDTQKRWMLTAMIATLFSWVYYHPETTNNGVHAEFPVLGQLAICTGMTYYLFTEETKQNRYIAMALVLVGMLAPKFKFMGEVVCFAAMLFYVKRQMNFKDPKTAFAIGLLMTVVLIVTWERFDQYYVSGWNNTELARPMTYKTSLKILVDYFPLGPGMGTFGTNAAWVHYSPLYPHYHLDRIWGLDRGGGFIADAFYPTLAQYGVVGVWLFCIYWKRRLRAINEIVDMKYYRVALMVFFCLAIEQTADTSWLSGKGMGYCMLLGLCLNANRNLEEEEELEEEENDNVNANDNENSAGKREQSDACISFAEREQSRAKLNENLNENRNENIYG